MTCPGALRTGLIVHDRERAYPAFLLFDAPDASTHLIDVDGHQVKEWDCTGFPSKMIDPQRAGGERGHLLVQPGGTSAVEVGRPERFGALYGERAVGQIDADGKLIWRWDLPDNARQHHDWERLSNGNTLLIAAVAREAPQVAEGLMADQALYEVTPDGEIAWTWFAGDHIGELGFSAEERTILSRSVRALGPEAVGPGFLGLNGAATLGPNPHARAGDKRFLPDNIIVTSRSANIVFIVDRQTGSIVWRIGPAYPALALGTRAVLPRPVDQIAAGQAAHMIPQGRPGAGNLLLFDDQGPSGIPPVSLNIFAGSRVLQIDPLTSNIVWEYNAEKSGLPAYTMHAFYGGNAERLPNGNTLINSAAYGRVLQVTPNGEIAWEFINPYFGRKVPSSMPGVSGNFLNRVQFVLESWMPHAWIDH